MNIILGFVGENAEKHYSFLKISAEKSIQDSLPINIKKSPDDKALFAVLQPVGFFPLSTPYYDTINQQLLMVHGYLYYGGRFPLSELEASKQIIKAGTMLRAHNRLELGSGDGGVFNFFVYDQYEGVYYVASDFSGIMPLFIKQTSAGIFFSSHIRVLANLEHHELDKVGIAERVCFHYSLGRRTIYKGIFQKNAGETLIYNLSTKRLFFVQPTSYYSEIIPFKNDIEAVEALYANYSQGIDELSRPNLNNGVMLSGGFDTRLVVHGLAKSSNPLTTLTLGDSENYEVSIASKVANMISSSHQIYAPVEDCQLTSQRIGRLIRTAETVAFPYCETGAKKIKLSGGETISTGYAGETVFGGQGFALLGDRLSSNRRFFLALTRSFGFPINFYTPLTTDSFQSAFEMISDFHLRQFLSSNKLFSSDFLGINTSEIEFSIISDIKEELERYLIHPPDTIEQLLERFWFENHVAREFGKQEWTLAQQLPIVLPTVHHSFLSLCTNLSPGRKLDHGLYLKLVKKYFGTLADIPTGNFPLPLTYPTPILWISRATRAYLDQKKVSHQISTRSRTSLRSGWSNFELWFREGNFLEESVNFIDYSIFSKEYTSNKINRWINWKERIFSGQDLLTQITISQLFQ